MIRFVDTEREALNLHELLVQHPAATFFMRVNGHSMKKEGIESGDLLVIDRTLTPTPGKLVVAIFQGEFTIERFKKQESSDSDFQVWGVIKHVIRTL